MSILIRGIPRLRCVARKALRCAVSGPFVGLEARQLPAARMTDVQKYLFDKPLTGQAAVDKLRAMARLNDDKYRTSVGTATQSYVESIVDDHIKEFGEDASTWSDAAKGRVYTSSLSDTSAGHTTLIVSLEPAPDPRKIVTTPGSLIDYVHTFPNGGFATTGSQYLQILQRQREIDGTPEDVYTRLMPEIIALNAQYRANGTDPECSIQLGANNSVFNERSVRDANDDYGYAGDLMITRANHIFDGGALWIRSYLRRLRGAVVTSSLHFGEAPLAGVDPVNDALALYLFKTNNTRGTRLASLRSKMVDLFGKDRAANGLADPEIRDWFESQLDWNVRMNTGILAAGDVMMGRLFQTFRLIMGPGTVATITPTEMANINGEAAMAAAIDKGEKQTIADNYTGPPTTVSPDPALPVLSPALAANFAPEIPKLSTMPYLPVFQTAADTMSAAAKDLPKSIILDQVSEVVSQQVQQAVDAIPDAASKPVSEVVRAVDKPEFRAPIQSATDTAVVSSMASMPAFAQVTAQFDAACAMQLVTMEVSSPMWAQMTAPSSSYVAATIEGAVATTIKHQLSQQAGEIQSRLVKAVDAVKQAAADKQALQDNLKKITDALKQKPNDQTLIDQQKALEAKLEAAEKAITDAEAERTSAESEQSANDEAAKSADEAAADAEKAAKERAAELSGELMKVGK